MTPRKFVDGDENEEVLDSVPERSTATDKELVKNLGKDNPSLVDNYWLNEIKSQEDTARQIMAICIVLLGASFTLLMSNSSQIFLSLANSSETLIYFFYKPIVSPEYLKVIYMFCFVTLIIGITCFFLIWVVTLE